MAQEWRHSTPAAVNVVAFSGDGSSIATGSSDGSVALFKASDGHFAQVVQREKANGVKGGTPVLLDVNFISRIYWSVLFLSSKTHLCKASSGFISHVDFSDDGAWIQVRPVALFTSACVCNPLAGVRSCAQPQPHVVLYPNRFTKATDGQGTLSYVSVDRGDFQQNEPSVNRCVLQKRQLSVRN